MLGWQYTFGRLHHIRTGGSAHIQSLDKVVSELATAVAGGTSTTQAQTDFIALFSSSSVSTTTINTAFNDLVKAVLDSKVVPGDLTTVAADQAAIQTDLKNLVPGKGGGSGTGTTGTGTGTTGTGTGTTGSGTGTTGSGSTGTSGHKAGHAHKRHKPVHVIVKTVKHLHAKTLSRLKKH